MKDADPLRMSGISYALAAAVLFGISTPLAKLLVGGMPPLLLAGLLYLGSGIGLLIILGVRGAVAMVSGSAPVRSYLRRQDLPWFAGAVLSGGVIAPVLLMTGLVLTPASTASLLLNLEGVLTAILAWFVFRESFDRRIFLGMALIVVASVILSWERPPEAGSWWGLVAIVAACAGWAVDNNLTRKVSAQDALQIAAIKGLAAGMVNTVLAVTLGIQWPGSGAVMAAAGIGLMGYGLSLVLFVLALRHLGTARTGAYFSAAPFIGAILSLLLLNETPGAAFLLAFALMAGGLWLHVTERHSHLHVHQAVRHTHSHRHDIHHQHVHDFSWDGEEPHTHEHVHEELEHRHAHFPDIHHRHEH
jgi:drug/metabolite transporter (DMT)-like permease